MVPPRRRLRRQVSYHESESEVDDETQDESFTESDEASPEPQIAPQRSKNAPTVSAVSTRRQARKTYAEEPSSDDGEDSDFSQNDATRAEASTTRSNATDARRAGRPRKERAAVPAKAGRRQKLEASSPRSSPAVRRTAPVTPKYTGPSQSDLWFMGKPCDWTSLPFEILRDILSYASYPLFDEQNKQTSSLAWLLSFRDIHPALLEASLSVLYFCPPATDATKAYNLLSMLSSTEAKTTNYNVKVKHLELEERSTLAYSAGTGLDSVDLGALVKTLPALIGLDIWSIHDDPVVRRRHGSSQGRNWKYPDSLFQALSDGPQRLKHFHWNARFLSKYAREPDVMYQLMHTVHLYAPFQSLQYLKFTSFFGDYSDRRDLDLVFASPPYQSIQEQNLEEDRRRRKEEQDKTDVLLSRAIRSLPNLRKTDFYMCNIVDGAWLKTLPTNLTHLGFEECERITSDGLQDFLESHGRDLQVLASESNPEIDIAFLPTLARDCPNLQVLEMDFKKQQRKVVPIAGLRNVQDDTPVYGKPTWPKMLRTIKLNNLHHSSASAADVFFSSLIEAAADLKDLRHLAMAVSLDVPWRDRAKIRDMWEEKFKRVFLRKPTPPNPYWWSMASFKEWKEKKVASVIVSPPKAEAKHIPLIHTDATATKDDSEAPIHQGKRKASSSGLTRRLRPRRNPASEDEDSAPGVSALGGSLRDMVMQTLEPHIQGMCDVVDVEISNLRPREVYTTLLTEADFLDSEPSGDEDWDGHDIDDEELLRVDIKRKRKWRVNPYRLN